MFLLSRVNSETILPFYNNLIFTKYSASIQAATCSIRGTAHLHRGCKVAEKLCEVWKNISVIIFSHQKGYL